MKKMVFYHIKYQTNRTSGYMTDDTLEQIKEDMKYNECVLDGVYDTETKEVLYLGRKLSYDDIYGNVGD